MTRSGVWFWSWQLKLRAALLVIVPVLGAASVWAADEKPQSALADKPYQIAWGPYLQNLTPQGVTVVWCDAGNGDEMLEYGQAAEQLGQALRVRTGEATISGLQPGTTYFYRVTGKPADGRAAATSAIASFTTPVEDVKSFSFAILSDTHKSKYAPDLAKRILAEKVDFVLHAGDRNPPAGGLIKPYEQVMQRIPMYLARGNHDPADEQRRFSAMPGPGDRQHYSFRWGNARFFCVNTEDRKGPDAPLKKGGAKYRWLENELKSCQEQWKFVFQHIPVYSAYDGDMNPDLDDERGLLEQYNVDVVFQGHQHNYDRSWPLRNESRNQKGVIYVTASGGCGGNEKFPAGENFWFVEKTWRGEAFIGVCKIDGQRATIRFVTADGQEFDSFELQAAVSAGAAKKISVPSPQQFTWHEQERIMFVHLSPATWQGVEHDDLSTPLDQITLPKLDTDQWCETAKAWGAKEVLFVAKHSGGFCWWQTDTNKYGVKNAAWKNGKGDLLEDVAKSCRKYGLNIGVYLFPGDRSLGIGGGGRARDPAKQDVYNKIFRQQLRETLEIASQYAPLTEVWFDGSFAIEVDDIIRKYAPNAVVFQGPQASIRWVGNEAGELESAKSWSTLTQRDLATGAATARHSDPDGDAWAPLEVNSRLYARNWFWSPKNESTRKSLDELMRFYYASAGQGAAMLLNSTPNTDGLIPGGDVQLYRALGQEIERRFGKPLKETAGQDKTLELDLGRPTLVNHAVIMEDYRQGERIRGYVLEGFDGRQWSKLCEGAHVGRKRIDCFDDAAVSKLRLRVTESAGQPLIRSFQAFHVDNFRLAPGQPLRSPWKQCGAWRMADFKDGKAALSIDLTPAITEAGQWEVLFRPSSGDVALSDEKLTEEGVRPPEGMIARIPGQPMALHVTRAAAVTKDADIRLGVTLEGQPADGVIQIRAVPH